MTNNEAMAVLEALMIENKDVLLRLKESNPEDYSAEKIFQKPLDKRHEMCYNINVSEGWERQKATCCEYEN